MVGDILLVVILRLEPEVEIMELTVVHAAGAVAPVVLFH
jgi:hypothetical protein